MTLTDESAAKNEINVSKAVDTLLSDLALSNQELKNRLENLESNEVATDPITLTETALPTLPASTKLKIFNDLAGIPVAYNDDGMVMPLAGRRLTYFTYNNSLAETTLFNESFLGGYPGNNGVINISWWVRWTNTTGTGRPPRLRMYLNTTLLLDYTLGNIASGTGRGWANMDATIRNNNNASIQFSEGHLKTARNAGTTTAVSLDVNQVYIAEPTENTGAAFTIKLTNTWPVADANLICFLESGEIKVFYKA